jgi:hypothetical protein
VSERSGSVRSRYRIGQVGVPYETKKKGKKIRGRKELAIYQSILYIYIYIYIRICQVGNNKNNKIYIP